MNDMLDEIPLALELFPFLKSILKSCISKRIRKISCIDQQAFKSKTTKTTVLDVDCKFKVKVKVKIDGVKVEEVKSLYFFTSV